MRTIGKEQCQFWHAKKRAKERLGIELTENLYNQMIAAIRDLRITNKKRKNDIQVSFIEDQSRRTKLFKAKIKDLQEFNIVYDCYRKTIVTFLYPEENTKMIYHYYDIFGNKINLKNEYGETWKLKDGELISKFYSFSKIEDNKWKSEDIGKIFIFDEEANSLLEYDKL